MVKLKYMRYLEYNEENIDLKNCEAPFIEEELYKKIHESTVILCHDVFIRCNYKEQHGILLVKRLREPIKEVFWPIGGRILRGIPTELSLIKKAKQECNLDLLNIEYLGTARTFFGEDPFGHSHGTDTLNLIYVADSEGELTLNNDHESPLLVTKESYQTIKKDLPKYVQYFFDKINDDNLWDSKNS
jgi:ADP-ribose pyrophosphatase YjhB (NUDIX family)